MRDVNGTEVKLGSKIAVSVGRRGYLKIGTVTQVRERAYKRYDHRTKEMVDTVSTIVNYKIENPPTQYRWDNSGYVKKPGKFVVIG